ncbi:MAG: DeoR/GlpR family DNA-binding transcription regulator [Verrucomicrobiota bacterium]
MLALQRHREILSILNTEGQVRVSDLAERFSVTEETIRRDLVLLEEQGNLVRTHGGAVTTGSDSMHEKPYWERELFLPGEKGAIAQAALEEIEPNETIFIDASSTALCLARELPDIELTVLTNSLQAALTIANRERIEIVGIGGKLSRFSLSFTGSVTVDNLREYHVNTAFFSCRGLSIDWGLSDANEEQALLRRNILTLADRRILLADHNKFNVKALRHIADWQEIDKLITDDGVNEELLQKLRDKNVNIKIATVI